MYFSSFLTELPFLLLEEVTNNFAQMNSFKEATEVQVNRILRFVLLKLV